MSRARKSKHESSSSEEGSSSDSDNESTKKQPKKSSKPKPGSTAVPFYESIGEEAPTINIYGLEQPFRAVIYSGSGGGKNELMINMLHALNKEFDNVVFITKTPNERMYEWIREKIDPEWYEFLDDTPPPDELPENCLLVLDDQILDKKKKDSNKVNNDKCFVYGRKSNISILYLTQIYAGVEGLSQIIRKNLTGFIFKDPTESDIPAIKKNMNVDDSAIEAADGKWVFIDIKKPKSDPERVCLFV